MKESYQIKALKNKFKTEDEFISYQQDLVQEGNRANSEKDLSHWNDLDWYIWDNNIEELYL